VRTELRAVLAGLVGPALLFLAGCYHVPELRRTEAVTPVPVTGTAPAVRVRLTAGANVLISSGAGLELECGSRRRSVAGGEKVSAGAGGVACGGSNWCSLDDTVTVSGHGEFVQVGDRRYRGRLKLFRSPERDLVVVNVVSLDEYLFSVVPCEIGPVNDSTIEAVKAQAVAARSFTLSRLGRRKGLGHDLFDSYLRDQEYRGAGFECELGRQAVLATAGEVLTCNGAPAEALYHGNCGGQTSNGTLPYLKGVLDAPRPGAKAYCADSPHYRWVVTVARDSLDAVVSRLACARRKVKSVRLDADRGSGRVKYLHFATDKGEVRVHGADFRSGMGLKSQNFELSLLAKSASISGRGWGHGVGLCQDGAVAMARAGADYRAILRHYYPELVLGRRY
jgi:stage II sporulation protein D